jgi:hypothetical protein
MTRISPTSKGAVAIVASLIVALGSACSPTTKNLNPGNVPGNYRPASPYALVVGVTGPNIEGAGSSGGLEEGLADFMANELIFERVVYPYRADRDDVDLIIRVNAHGDFRPGGMKNFFTWFPGALLFLTNFRGTRWNYDATAQVDVLDADSREPIGKYSAKSSYISVHRSVVPGPIAFAPLAIPVLIQGSKATKPRRPYTTNLYREAYPNLWKQVTAKIVAADAQYLAAAEKAQSRRRVARAPPPRSSRYSQGSSSSSSYRPPPSPRRRPPPTPATTATYKELYSNRVAVVVGIDRYGNGWPKLNGAASDARRVAQYLKGSGFDHVIEIYDGDATRQRLLQVLGNELGDYVGPDSMVFIYFAGHGDTETLPGGSKRGYLIPADADDDVFSTGISMDTVRDLSNRMTAKHVLYAIDACYSGLSLTRGISVPRKTSGYLQKVTQMRAVQILAAGSEGEPSIEVEGQGLFTTYLLRGIDGEADLDGDGAVTAREIGAYLRPQVTEASGARQTPQFGTIEGSGEVVFLKR